MRTTTTNQRRTFIYIFIYLFMNSIMDFTTEENAEDSNHQTNTNDKLFDVSGEALALVELVRNQV